ncbi:cysteine desulfurase family protein [Coraliomargarita parva]|uniref:cysteine desulfurase family protein n=1 Tax=Coraliomargarita parva TaxID=3014050 RepID=UPI0022B3789F|nr:aminotransferase class V-fold PLP-dependent enzyme [Coraliomargarita parva]
MDPGYFDCNATTALWPEARAAWVEAVEQYWMNPSSPYRAAARAQVRMEAARAALAARFGLVPERVVFNSGASEGNNAVFAHWARCLPAEARVGVSPTEHPSVTEAARHYFGDRVRWLELGAEGAVSVEALGELLREGRLAAVSAMAANNETGILNDWQTIAGLCREAGVPYHCDASQWIGKMPLAGLGDCGIVTACGHKFGGPRGVGFWLLAPQMQGFEAQRGGAQEAGVRAGTPDLAGILALEAALRVAESVRTRCDAAERDRFVRGLCQAIPGTECVGEGMERLWNTTCLILPEFASVRWIRALEKRGFYVSSGSACSTGKEGPSPVLAAMGLSAGQMRRAIRVSSTWSTRPEDWDALAAAFLAAYHAMKEEAGRSGNEVISI